MTWFAAFALLPLATALLALAVDPDAKHPSVHVEALDLYRDHGTRAAKLAALERGSWKTLVFGDSRSHAGVDPTHAVWAEGGPTYNAALPATSAREAERLMQVAFAHSEPERVVLIVQLDFFDRQFDAHPLPRSRGKTEEALQSLLGWPSFVASWQTLSRVRKGQASGTGPTGMRRRVEPANTRAAFGRILRQVRKQSRNFGYSQAGAAAMKRMVALCRARGVETYVAVAPIHATMLEAFESVGWFGAYEIMLGDVAALASDEADSPVHVWDFSGYAGLRAEPLPEEGSTAPMQWYYEASHIRPELAAAMVEEMFSATPGEPGALGFRLRPDTLDADLERIETERRLYLGTSAAQLDFVREHLGDASGS